MQMYLLHKNIGLLFQLEMQEKSMSDFEKLCEEFAKTGIDKQINKKYITLLCKDDWMSQK